jgi:hypothetical protein
VGEGARARALGRMREARDMGGDNSYLGGRVGTQGRLTPGWQAMVTARNRCLAGVPTKDGPLNIPM